MDIGKSITFLYEDERWLEKLGIGVALVLISMALSVVLIGIVGFFILAGYCIRLMRNVRDGAARPLPEWDRWGEDMATGFKYFVVMLIYALPIFAIMIPVTLGSVIASQGRGGEGFGIIMILCTMLLAFLYAFFLTVMQPGITIAYARDEEIRSGLEVGLIWEWTRRNIGPVLIVTLLYWAIGAVVGILAPIAGVILCVVGLIVTIPLGILLPYLIQGHLFGQLARIPMEAGYGVPVRPEPYAWSGEPSPVAPPAGEQAPAEAWGAAEEPAPPAVDERVSAVAVGPVVFDLPEEPPAPAEQPVMIEPLAVAIEPSIAPEPPVVIEPPVTIEPLPAADEVAGVVPDAPSTPSAEGPSPDEPQNPA